MKSFPVAPCLCPGCGATLDRASNNSECAPKPGDISVCIFCAAPLVFDDRLRPGRVDFSKLNPDELQEVRRMVQTVVDFIAFQTLTGQRRDKPDRRH